MVIFRFKRMISVVIIDKNFSKANNEQTFN